MKYDIDKNDLYVVKDIPIYYLTPFEPVQGMLNGVDDNKIDELYNSIHKCTCGGNPIGVQTECMGDFDFEIYCDNPKCERYIRRSMYDFDVRRGDGDEIELAIRDWNNKLNQEDFNKLAEEEHQRVVIKADDLEWKDIIANNIINNPKEGIYCILNKKYNDKFYACKWSIIFQSKEIEPMYMDSTNIDLYILFQKRYFDLDKPLSYPEPSNRGNTYDINSYGEFIRAYRTLEEAKEGARARCGWQGINKDTIFKGE